MISYTLVYSNFAGSCYVCHTMKSMCFLHFMCFSSSACRCLLLLHLCFYKSRRLLQGFFFNSTSLKLYLSQLIWSNYQKTWSCLRIQRALIVVNDSHGNEYWLWMNSTQNRTDERRSSLKLSQVSNHESDVSNKTSGENNRTIGRPKVN